MAVITLGAIGVAGGIFSGILGAQQEKANAAAQIAQIRYQNTVRGIQTDLNNSGTSTSTDCGSSVPVDTQNLRLKVNLSSAGVVTYELVVNEIAGAGTLAAPASTAAFTFDDGDVLVPYLAILKNGTATDEIFLKDITVTRTPGDSFERL